jgi:2-haloacid dehalogenase
VVQSFSVKRDLMAHTQIKALAFDVFGTTVDWCGGVARESKAMLEPKGVKLDWIKFANRWRREYQPAMGRVRSGERPYAVLDVLHREMLDVALAEFGVTALSEAEKQELAMGWRRLDPWPDVVEGMERLKKRLILAAVSNGNIALVVAMARRASLPWDVVLGAELVKTYKPEPQIYDSAVALLGLEPSQVMMVACHPWDLDAAARRGLRTAYVRRPDEYGPGVGSERPADDKYDVTAESFVELAEKLGA